MSTERTLAIVKPDAVGRSLTGEVLRRIEGAGLSICALKLIQLTRAQVEQFYQVHRQRPFFESLCSYMSSGPVVLAALEGEQAITRWRELMGATDPAKAAPGTVRKDLGVDVEKNAVHGSDGPETAAVEIPFFFSEIELAKAGVEA
jgi:nucleoside-diphosphate kinase